MEELQKIFQTQLEFEKLFVDFEKLKDDPDYRDKLMMQFTLYLNRETFELLDEFNWKPHVDPHRHNRDLIIQEVVDVFTFVVNLCLINSISVEELVEGFFYKNQINWERQQQRAERSSQKS